MLETLQTASREGTVLTHKGVEEIKARSLVGDQAGALRTQQRLAGSQVQENRGSNGRGKQQKHQVYIRGMTQALGSAERW